MERKGSMISRSAPLPTPLSIGLLLLAAGCADTEAPRWSGAELAIEGEPGALEVVWPAAEADDVEAYLVRVDGEPAARLGPEARRYAIDGLDTGQEHRVQVVAVDSASNESVALEAVTEAGSPPVFGEGSLTALAYGAPDATQTAYLGWPQAEDDVGVVSYVVRVDGDEAARVEPPAHELALNDVAFGASPTISVVALDADGHESEALSVTDAFRPTFPEGAQLELDEEDDVSTLRWPAATDDVAVVAYVVRRDGEEIARLAADALEHPLDAETEDDHRYAVDALDAAEHHTSLSHSNRAATRLAVEEAQAEVEQMLLGALGEQHDLADVLAGGAVTGNSADILAQSAGVGVARSYDGPAREAGGGGRVGSNLGALRAGRGGLAGAGRGDGPRGGVALGALTHISGPGTFPRQTVTRMLRARLRAVQSCYERELASRPTIAGLVRVELTIATTGTVTGARNLENTTGSEAVAQCAVNVVRRLRFSPGPEDGDERFSVHYTFAPRPD